MRDLQFGDFRLTAEADVLYHGPGLSPLEPRPVQLLRYLVHHRDRIVSKRELLDRVWHDRLTTEAVVKQAVAEIRRVLGDDARRPLYIATHHRRGYRFIARVSEAAPEPPRPSAGPDDPQAGAERLFGDLDFTRLVARRQELSALEAEFRRALDGGGDALLLAGDPGVGKTMLAHELARRCQTQGALFLEARFYPEAGGGRAPYEIFLDLLRRALEVEPDGSYSATDLSRKLRQTLGVVLPPELVGSDPAEVPPAPPPDEFRVIRPLCDALLGLSRRRPVVLVLDDLQWASAEDLRVLGGLLRSRDGEPLLPLLLARTEDVEAEDHHLAAWLARQAWSRSFRSLEIRPFDLDDSRRVLEAAVGGAERAPAVPTADLETLQQLTGGNAYMLSEMLRWLVLEGVLVPPRGGEPSWRWRGIRQLQLPRSLAMAARQRIGGLPPPVRDLIEQAAVLGDVFRLDTVVEMSDTPETDVLPLFDQAVSCGVLATREVPVGQDYRFHHALLRRAIYDAIPPSRRRRLHLSAAAALGGRGEAPSRAACSLGYHYEAAAAWPLAYDFSRRALDAARRLGRWPEAVADGERALRAAAELKAESRPRDRHAELLLGLGEAYYCVGRLHDSERTLRRALSHLPSPDARRGEAQLHLSRTLGALGSYREAAAAAERSLRLFEQQGSRQSVGRALLQWSTLEVAMGDYDRASTRVKEALRLLPPEGADAAAACALLGWAAALGGRYEEAAEQLERALGLYRASADARQCALVAKRLHWVCLSRGHYHRAIALALEARGEFRRIGDLNGEIKADLGIGQSRLAQGLHQEAIGILKRVLQELEHLGDVHCQAEAEWLLARALVEDGDLESAEPLLADALAKVRKLGDRDDEFRVLVDFARLRRRQGHGGRGHVHAAAAAAQARQLGSVDGEGVALVEQALCALELGRPDEAASAAARAVELLEATGSGERWRGHWARARALEAIKAEGRSTLSAEAMRQHLVACVGQLREQLEQIPADDTQRRALFTEARKEPVEYLRQLRRRCYHLVTRWGEATKNGAREEENPHQEEAAARGRPRRTPPGGAAGALPVDPQRQSDKPAPFSPGGGAAL